jgi:dTMP kinase
MAAKRGKFVTIDGPNGVGKTTVVHLVCEYLRVLGWDILETKEPTSTFNRANEDKHGPELARLIIEDRRRHLGADIEPALREGVYVICDRYVESSFVYRKLDGISFEDTWQENSSFRIPDMSILLVASVPTIEMRVKGKKALSRFERESTSDAELLTYQEAHQFLSRHGFKSVVVGNDEATPQAVAKHMSDLIVRLP